MTNVVIASAARTAVGSFGGSFANTPAHDLGAAVLEAVVERAGVDKAEVSETILGQVLTRRPRPEPGPSGPYQRWLAAGKQRLGHQPGLWFGSARRGAWRTAHPAG